MIAQPRFLQGIFPFQGTGLDNPQPIGGAEFTVPAGSYAQPTYFRAGNSADELIYLVLRRDSVPIRYFPVGAKSDSHVALAVLEDMPPGTVLDILVAAPSAVTGSTVIDMGILLTNNDY